MSPKPTNMYEMLSSKKKYQALVVQVELEDVDGEDANGQPCSTYKHQRGPDALIYEYYCSYCSVWTNIFSSKTNYQFAHLL